MRRRRILRSLIGITFLSVTLFFWDQMSWTHLFEKRTLDFRYRYFNPGGSFSKDLVLVDIGESDLKTLEPLFGRWPWSRSVIRQILEFVSMGEPRAILFDILFTESQRSECVVGEGRMTSDQELALSCKEMGNISFAMQFTDSDEENPLPSGFREFYGLKTDIQEEISWKDLFLHEGFRDHAVPAKEFLFRVPMVHVVNFPPDLDGVFRSSPLLFHFDQSWYPSLGLRGILSLLDQPKITLDRGELEIQSQSRAPLHIRLDERGRVPLYFYKASEEPTVVSVSAIVDSSQKVLSGKVADPSKLAVNPEIFNQKVVIIGTSAVGLSDLKNTPIDNLYPGVNLHTTLISNVLKEERLTDLTKLQRDLIVVMILLSVYLGMVLIDHIALRVVLPIGVGIFYIAISLWIFQEHAIALPMAMPLVYWLLSLGDGLSYLALSEARATKKIKSTLSRYLSPQMTDQLVREGKDPTAEVGHHETLSVLFSDIRGFTSLSEKMEVRSLVALLNEYLGEMTSIVFQHSGTLDKFIGDAVMAFWGAPIADPNHALHAVLCAMEMKFKLNELNQNWRSLGCPPLEIGVGINTGDVIVGNIGSELRLNYTVIGDNVNLASRIEGLTKYYGTSLLVGEECHELIRTSILCRPVDLVRVKGKDRPVSIFEPLCQKGEEAASGFEEFACKTTEAFSAYRRGAFQQAALIYEEIDHGRLQVDPLSRLFVKRCRALVDNPPTEWDGIYTATSK